MSAINGVRIVVLMPDNDFDEDAAVTRSVAAHGSREGRSSAVAQRTVQCVEALRAQAGPSVNVVEVPARHVALVGTTRLSFRARRRAEESLRERVGW